MKFVIQRVGKASVEIDSKIFSQIDKGYLVLVGISDSDTKEIADKMIQKLIGLRIFEDENGKTNLSIKDVDGKLLIVSQFTLYADCKKGNRPSFIKAGNPEFAKDLYLYILEKTAKLYEKPVYSGEFGADMKISLENNGPFTIILDSSEIITSA